MYAISLSFPSFFLFDFHCLIPYELKALNQDDSLQLLIRTCLNRIPFGHGCILRRYTGGHSVEPGALQGPEIKLKLLLVHHHEMSIRHVRGPPVSHPATGARAMKRERKRERERDQHRHQQTNRERERAGEKEEKGIAVPSSESQSCWDEGSEGRARALYSNTTELEMIWLLAATCSVTSPVS